MAPKGKKHARSESASSNPPSKQARTETASSDPALKHPSRERAREIDADPPYFQLQSLLAKTSSDHKPRNVLHWFRSKDLRQEDNKALHAASKKAEEGGASLITMYVFCAEELEWHGTSPARMDFMLESLRLLKEGLQGKGIPLAVLQVVDRKAVVGTVVEFVKKWDVSHVFGNMEYEIDELRRDIKVAGKLEEEGVGFEVLHDQTCVEPLVLKGQGGGPIKVFTPYHKAWLVETKKKPELFAVVEAPEGNGGKAKEEFKELFDTHIPSMPEGKGFESKEEEKRIRKLWPPGHEAGMQRLQHFLDKKVSKYAEHRIEPFPEVSSRLSPYIATGIISIREILSTTHKWNNGQHFDAHDVGVDSWVRELVFREFYRHMLVITPHGAMNMPQNVKFDLVKWEDDEEGWKKWCAGTTGVPWVDAGMRQLNTEAWMHNRLRMAVSSYLSGNLLIDYRRGERYFATHLIDFDLANNTNGWEPSYTIFNPIAQAEKCDKEGKYIKKWVPELKGVEGKAIFAPSERMSKKEFEKLDYPAPHVDFSETAARAKERYKRDLHSED